MIYANSRFWWASLTIEGNCFVLRCLFPFKLDNQALIVITIILLAFDVSSVLVTCDIGEVKLLLKRLVASLSEAT